MSFPSHVLRINFNYIMIAVSGETTPAIINAGMSKTVINVYTINNDS